MDSLTHTLLGLLLARTALGSRLTLRAASVIGVLAANAPDIDIALWAVADFETYVLYRQGISHSIWAAMVFSILIAAVGVRLTSQRFVAIVGLVTAALAAHLMLDGLTAFGIEPFAPLTSTVIGRGTLFQTDLILLAILSSPLWIPPITRIDVRRVAHATAAVAAGYIVVVTALQSAAMASQPPEALGFAAPLTPWRWSSVVDGDPVELRAVDIFSGTVARRRHSMNADHPAVLTALASPLGRRFTDRAAGPWWAEVRCRKTGFAVLLFSARTSSAWVEPQGPLVIETQKTDGDTLHVTDRWFATWVSSKAAPTAECETKL